MKPNFLHITVWLNRHCPVPTGYFKGDSQDTARFRLGPIVIGWEKVEHR